MKKIPITLLPSKKTHVRWLPSMFNQRYLDIVRAAINANTECYIVDCPVCHKPGHIVFPNTIGYYGIIYGTRSFYHCFNCEEKIMILDNNPLTLVALRYAKNETL